MSKNSEALMLKVIRRIEADKPASPSSLELKQATSLLRQDVNRLSASIARHSETVTVPSNKVRVKP